MRRRIKIAEDDLAQEPMLPLINIVFLLLIFFMIAGSLQKLGPFDVNPPTSKTAESQPENAVVLWFGKTGQIGIDDKLGTIEDLAKLLPSDVSTRPVEIRADQSVDGVKVVTLLRRLQELGVEKVQLMTAADFKQE